MLFRQRALSLSAFMMSALASIPARATVVTPMELTTLVAQSERVAHAKVEAQVARWTTDRTAIYTDVTLRVSEPLKGDMPTGQRITLRREGGEVDGIGMRVSGAAQFQVGEEVVVFLERRGAALWTVGMSQGKYRVSVDNGRKMAVRDVSGLGFIRQPPREPAVRPLDELLTAIRTEVRRAPQGGR